MTCRSYKVYHVSPSTEDHIAFLKDLEGNPEVDFWTEARRINKNVDVMVSPKFQSQFEEELTRKGIKNSIMFKNVEE